MTVVMKGADMNFEYTPSMPLLGEQLREQLRVWPLAAANFAALGQCERRPFSIGTGGALHGAFQLNPARMVSTAAKTDAASLASRPCFLCAGNRPKEQYMLPWRGPSMREGDGQKWEILVNPYPILPFHLVMAAAEHKPQLDIPADMIAMAEMLPGAAIFFNGAQAGASAPDHEHCQIVLAEELPLLQYLEGGGHPGDLPFNVEYYDVTPDMAGLEMMESFLRCSDPTRVNAFAWLGRDGRMRLLKVRRRAWRPSCYPEMMVSPGSIDVAGLIILPRREDFERITEADLLKIYSETIL